MCYQVEVLEYNGIERLLLLARSKFLAYHETEVEWARL